MAGFRHTRLVLAASLAYGIAGCAGSGTNFDPQDAQFANMTCRAVATDRATDAGIIADDVDMQRQVFRLTYSDCVSWHSIH